jgi:hypothetical protein
MAKQEGWWLCTAVLILLMFSGVWSEQALQTILKFHEQEHKKSFTLFKLISYFWVSNFSLKILQSIPVVPKLFSQWPKIWNQILHVTQTVPVQLQKTATDLQYNTKENTVCIETVYIFYMYTYNDFNCQFHLIILRVCDTSVGPGDSSSGHKPLVRGPLVYKIDSLERSSTNALWFTGQFTMTTKTACTYKCLVWMKLPLYSSEF